jgi:hypothetical protein
LFRIKTKVGFERIPKCLAKDFPCFEWNKIMKDENVSIIIHHCKLHQHQNWVSEQFLKCPQKLRASHAVETNFTIPNRKIITKTTNPAKVRNIPVNN